MDEPNPPLQTFIQINFYRLNNGRFEYLVLKRANSQKDLWQGVTEKVPDGGDIAETVKHAADRQVGIRGFRRLSEEMYSYEWYTNGERGRDIVFAAEITPQTNISVDNNRYSDFQWLPYDQALLHLKWSGAKDALQELNTFLEGKLASNPEYWAELSPSGNGNPQGNFNEQATFDVGQTAMEHSQDQQNQQQPSRPSPYGPNAPKRLPDRPGTGGMGRDDEPDVNTGEWFL